MNDDLAEIFGKYKKKGIFVDTNILIVYLVGTVNPKLIARFNRSEKHNFDENDFILISKFIEFFEIKITSPHVLAEVSNLLDRDEDFCLGLKTYIESCEERFVDSQELASSKSFSRLGLADSSIVEISRNNHLVFTEDGELFGYLNNQGIDVINFEWLNAYA